MPFFDEESYKQMKEHTLKYSHFLCECIARTAAEAQFSHLNCLNFYFSRKWMNKKL